MAAPIYRIDRASTLGNQLLNLLDRINADFAQLKTLRLAMIQQRTGDGSAPSHFAEMAKMFGYLQADGTPDTGAVAQGSFMEIDSWVANGGPSLEQCGARHRQ